jgi:hypothetical protein
MTSREKERLPSLRCEMQGGEAGSSMRRGSHSLNFQTSWPPPMGGKFFATSTPEETGETDGNWKVT